MGGMEESVQTTTQSPGQGIGPQSKDPVRCILRNTRCIELLKGQQVIEIDAEDSVAKGCQVCLRGL